jgi:RNA polymerase sigma-70 factor (ECF subfamily)
VSLNTPHENDRGDTREMINRVDSEGTLRPCQPDTREIEINNLRMDVARVLDTLPEDLRDLCERLRESNMAEIARETGIARTTLYDKLTRIREAFRQAGLDDFF